MTPKSDFGTRKNHWNIAGHATYLHCKVNRAPTRAMESRAGYQNLLVTVSDLLEKSRRGSARVINSFMTATYWEIGRRIVEFEQRGKKRSEYGQTVLERLSKDLTRRHGRGFARSNLIRFRQFYVAFPRNPIRSTVSNELEATQHLARSFPMPWSHYVLLISRARSTDALPNKLLVHEYLTALPNEKVLSIELAKSRRQLEQF